MAQPFDPILIEVMKNESTAVAEDLGMTMKRTAQSLGAKEGSDFSTALVDELDRLVAQNLTTGVPLGYIMGVMPRVLEKFRNDPHHWGRDHVQRPVWRSVVLPRHRAGRLFGHRRIPYRYRRTVSGRQSRLQGRVEFRYAEREYGVAVAAAVGCVDSERTRPLRGSE